MKIGLIDCDYTGKFPNIPLMKLSAWHKQHGDSVQWYDPFSGVFDRVYISKVFSFSADFGYYVNAKEIINGGTGYAITTENGRERIVYCLVNFDTTFEQDLERVYTLRELDFNPYIMIYNKKHCAKIYNHLQRWVNNRFIFETCKKFEDYNP